MARASRSGISAFLSCRNLIIPEKVEKCPFDGPNLHRSIVRIKAVLLSKLRLEPLYCPHRLSRGTCACRKLNPGILVMQSAQGWATKNVLGAIDGARDRCIFLQG